jgi:hypothetical protein
MNTDQHDSNLQDMESSKSSAFSSPLKVKIAFHKTSHRLSKFIRKAIRSPMKPQQQQKEFIELLSPVDSPFHNSFCPQNLHHEAACSPNDAPSSFFPVQVHEEKEPSHSPGSAHSEPDCLNKRRIWSPKFNMRDVRVLARVLRFVPSGGRPQFTRNKLLCRRKQDEALANVYPFVFDTAQQEDNCMMRSSLLRGSFLPATINPMHNFAHTTKVNQEPFIAEKMKSSIPRAIRHIGTNLSTKFSNVPSYQAWIDSSLTKRFSCSKNDCRPVDLWDEKSGIDINSLWGENGEFSGHLRESLLRETSSYRQRKFAVYIISLYNNLKETVILINTAFSAVRSIGRGPNKNEETLPRSTCRTKRCSVEELIPSPARGSARVLQPLSSPLGTNFYIRSGRQQETEIFERGSVPFGRI